MFHVNILKRIKSGERWKFVAIPKTPRGGPDWGALPDGLYYIEWYLAGKRRREQAGKTASQALEGQRRKNHDLEGRQLRVKGFEHAGEETRTPPLHLAVERFLTQTETLKKPHTLRKYRCVLHRFLEHFKERPTIDAIANEDIDDFIVTLMRKHRLSANTVIHNTVIIAQFLRRQGRPNVTNPGAASGCHPDPCRGNTRRKT